MVTVLIVEDDELMARLYRKVFNFEGFQVELASDGQAGLDKAREVKPNLILLDVMMPRMNGLEALDKLKADPATKAIPVVMLTNLAGQQDAEQAIAKGALRYIIKSENEPQDVAAAVKEVLAQVGGGAPASPTPASEGPAPATAPTSAAPSAPAATTPGTPTNVPAPSAPPAPADAPTSPSSEPGQPTN